MTNDRMAVYVGLLERAKGDTLAVAAKIPAGGRLNQLQPGKATPLWLLGHLATAADGIVTQGVLNAPGAVPANVARCFMPDFMGGQAPTTNASDYPAWDDLTAIYEKAMAALIEAVSVLDDSALADTPRGSLPEPLLAYFPNLGSALELIIGHDAYHRGQMVLLAGPSE